MWQNIVLLVAQFSCTCGRKGAVELLVYIGNISKFERKLSVKNIRNTKVGPCNVIQSHCLVEEVAAEYMYSFFCLWMLYHAHSAQAFVKIIFQYFFFHVARYENRSDR